MLLFGLGCIGLSISVIGVDILSSKLSIETEVLKVEAYPEAVFEVDHGLIEIFVVITAFGSAADSDVRVDV